MSGAQQLLAGGSSSSVLYSDDVFLSYLRSGTGASASITAGFNPDLVWTKARSAATGHRFTDSSRGVTKSLDSSSTAAEATEAQGLTSFDTSGYTIGTDTDYNNSTGPVTYVDWAFKKAAKFFDVQTATLSSGNATVSFSNLSTLGMVIVKRTDNTGSWYVWHRSLTAGKLLYLEQTAAEATLGHITVSGTTLTLVDGTLADGDYVCYGFAHDTDTTNGIIQCGSYTGIGGSIGPHVSLGWEPQFVLIKGADEGAENWMMYDTMRRMDVITTGADNVKELRPNTSDGESNQNRIYPTATGFQVSFTGGSTVNTLNKKYIYLAIRRPNKPPTSGTQVYSGNTTTGATGTVISVGFPLDMRIEKWRTSQAPLLVDRLRGVSSSGETSLPKFQLDSAQAEGNSALTRNVLNTSFEVATVNSGQNQMYWSFRRAPGVFDIICYSGTGSNKTESHSLTVAPEMVICKNRSDATGRSWAVWHSGIANTEYLVLNTAAAKASGSTYWNSTSPTATTISLGTANSTNENGDTFVAYLFATKAGISHVGYYTGNGGTDSVDGSSQTINCGFSTGARFVLIKRVTNSGSWYIFDSVRGIVAGNDPYVLVNSSAAEVSTVDALDADTTGFIVNQTSGTNLNVTGDTYIVLALA